MKLTILLEYENTELPKYKAKTLDLYLLEKLAELRLEITTPPSGTLCSEMYCPNEAVTFYSERRYLCKDHKN